MGPRRWNAVRGHYFLDSVPVHSVSLGSSRALARKGRASQTLLTPSPSSYPSPSLSLSLLVLWNIQELWEFFKVRSILLILNRQLLASAWHVFGLHPLFLEDSSVVTGHSLHNCALHSTGPFIHLRSTRQIRPTLWCSRGWKHMWPARENFRVTTDGPVSPRITEVQRGREWAALTQADEEQRRSVAWPDERENTPAWAVWLGQMDSHALWQYDFLKSYGLRDKAT